MPIYGSEAIEEKDIIPELGSASEGVGMLTTFDPQSTEPKLRSS